MGTDRLRVVLAMETSLLSSAIQQCLAGNTRLDVNVRPRADDACVRLEPTHDDSRTVYVGLLDDPVRFEIHTDGREWIMEYQDMYGLALLLADLEIATA